MHVLIISKNIGMMRGGGATRTFCFANGLTERGAQVGVVYARPWLVPERYPVEGPFEVHTVRSPYLRDLSYRLPKGRGLVPRLDDRLFAYAVERRIGRDLPVPDVFLTFGNFPLAARLKTRFGKPVVVSSAGGLPSGDVGASVRAVDAVVGDGAELASFEERFGVAPIEIRKGVDTRRFHPEPDSGCGAWPSGAPVRLLWSGRLVPVKNVPLALCVVESLTRRGVDAHLTILGAGSLLGPLERRSRSMGIAGRVHFAGHVASEYLPRKYREADLFILTSTFDNFPNAILEAMASGLPVVATNVGGVSTQIADGVNGFLVPSGDAEAMADAVLRIVSNPARRRGMAERNREETVTRYDWSTSLDRLFELCLHLVDPLREHVATVRETRRERSVA